LSFYAELKRRNVFKVAIAYTLIAWGLLEVSDTLGPAMRLPEWLPSAVAFLLILGFPIAIVFAWALELTPDGLKMEKGSEGNNASEDSNGKTLNPAIAIALILALSYLAFDKLVIDPGKETAEMTADAPVTQQQTAAVASAEVDNSIAVLPFVNMSSDKEQEYFSEGLSEELLNLLAKIPELSVAARTSSFSYKGKDTKIAQIGEELNVAHVLEGSVRKSGNQVRITAQLIRTDNGFPVWSETYRRTLTDIFATQDEIAASVVEALKVSILGAIPTQRKTNPEVYSLYLQGKFFNGQGDNESVQKAFTTLKQALAIDPNYAPAWVELNFTYSLLGRNGTLSIAEGARLAHTAVDRALAIDSNMGSAWAARAYLKRTFDRDWAGAQAAIERAIEVDPNNGSIVSAAAALARTLGQFPRAIALLEQSVALDPLSPGAQNALARMYTKVGRFDDAINTLDRLMTLRPNYSSGARNLSRAYLLKGDPKRALTELEKNPHPANDVHKARIHFTLGNEAQSQALIKELLASLAHQYPGSMSSVYAWRGERDATFEWLELSFQHGDSFSNFLGIVWMRGLVDDPRYAIFLEKIGLLEEWKTMPPEYGGPSKP